MKLPPLLEHVPGDELVRDPSGAIEGQPSFRDEDVDMRVPLEIGAEGVHDRDNPRGKSLGLTPVQERPLRGGEQDTQLRTIPTEDIPKLCGDGEHDMVIRHVDKPAQRPFDPLIHHDLPAGGTEP